MQDTRQLTNIDIFENDVAQAMHTIAWFQRVTDRLDIGYCHPQMRSWPTHPQFCVGNVNPEDLSASTWWKIGAALDMDGGHVEVKVKDSQLVASWSKGDRFLELIATVDWPDDSNQTFRSLTDLAQGLR